MQDILLHKQALLLDMNNTFMFGEDRFGPEQDYSIYYRQLDGGLSDTEINQIITAIFLYLEQIYPLVDYRENFPTLREALDECVSTAIPEREVEKIIQTFAYHELGQVPQAFIDTLAQLRRSFILALVIDNWSPKHAWLNYFESIGITSFFSAMSFSSDCAMVKPSPKPFLNIIQQLALPSTQCLMIGDSVERDLQGAIDAGLDCVLVGGACDTRAVGCYTDLLEFSRNAQNVSERNP